MTKTAKAHIFAILLLTCIAAFFRFHQLDQVPIGLWRDEAANGLEALRVLEGHRTIFYGTREPIFIYLVAASVAFLGRTPVAIRIVAALAGTVTVPMTYLLVKEVFGRTDRRARLVAFLTSFWLATSYWHLNFSRLGFRGVLLPLFASLSFYLFWRGWNQPAEVTRRRSTLAWFATAGLCFGLTFYTYTPSRFLPLVFLPFLGETVRRSWAGRAWVSRWGEPAAIATSSSAALAVFALCGLLVFAPLGVHFVADPGSFFLRWGVSVFRVADNEPLISLLAQNVVQQLGMFGFLADPNVRHDPAARPAFDLFTLAFFVAGFIASLSRSRKMPCLFCMVWFLVMLLPAILTYPELPHYLRAIGALPVAYVFPALGLETAWEWLRARFTSFKIRSAVAACLGLCLMLTAVLTYRDYFWPHVEEIELVKAFDPRFVEQASLMNELDEPGAVWIIPLGPHDEQRMAYFVIDFLYRGEAPHRYVHLDDATLAEELTNYCQDRERALVLRRTEDPLAQPWYDLYSDSRGLLSFVLEKHCQRSGTMHFENVDVLVYQLNKDTVFSLPSELQPVQVDFGNNLRLTGSGYDLGAAQPGQAWVILRWQVGMTPRADYGVEVALTDQNDELAARVNKPLLSSEMRPTSEWESGQQEIDYYSLSGLPENSRGSYSIHVSVYPIDVDSGVTSPIATAEGSRSFTVGSLAPTVATLD